MILFLTSSPTGDLDGKYTCIGFDNRNGFAHEVKKYWRNYAKVLMISAFPDDRAANKEMGEFFHSAILKTGLACSKFDLWDCDILRDPSLYSRERLQAYDVILLGGGHVPTQQAFFRKLHLRESIAGFDGIVIGISAGTMNSADLVYAQPEEPGEATDPQYERFIQGLGITKLNILPHYQLAKNSYKDGMHLFTEITIPDSKGRTFYAIPDGSYIVDYNGKTKGRDGAFIEPAFPVIYGEAYRIQNGELTRCCQDGVFLEIQ